VQVESVNLSSVGGQTRGEKGNRVPSRAPTNVSFIIPPTPNNNLYLLAEMAEQSIKSLFSSAERQRKDVVASWDSNTAIYQQNLAAAIATYDECLKLADRLSLFSPNETLEDLTSGDLQ
jgi:hypothetical protein